MPIRQRFDDELVDLLLAWRWWEMDAEALTPWLPLLCDPRLDEVKRRIREEVDQRIL